MATQVAAGVVVPGEQGHLPREEPAGRRGRPGRSPWEGAGRDGGSGEREGGGAGEGRDGVWRMPWQRGIHFLLSLWAG